MADSISSASSFHSANPTFSEITEEPVAHNMQPENGNTEQQGVTGALELENGMRQVVTNVPESSISWKAKFNIVVIGVWVFCSTPLLSLPFAVREGGWLGICFFLGFGVLTFFTAWLLPYFLDGEASYQELGNTAMGATGSWIAFVFSCVYSYATCIDSVMIENDNLRHLFPVGADVLIILLVIVSGLLLWYNNFEEYEPFFPRIGLLLTFLVIVCLACRGLFDVGFHAKTDLFYYPKLHLAVGFYAYCFCGHSYLPRIYHLINNKTEYRKMLIVIFLISTILYVVTGCLAYAMYGVDVESIFTLNFPSKSIVSQIAIYSTVMTHMIRYELNMSTLATTLEGTIPEARRTQRCRRLIRSVLVLSTLVGIFGTPIYAPLVSLSGSVIGVLMSLTIPSLCFFIIKWENLLASRGFALIRIQGMLWGLALLVSIFGSGFTIIRSILAIN